MLLDKKVCENMRGLTAEHAEFAENPWNFFSAVSAISAVSGLDATYYLDRRQRQTLQTIGRDAGDAAMDQL